MHVRPEPHVWVVPLKYGENQFGIEPRPSAIFAWVTSVHSHPGAKPC